MKDYLTKFCLALFFMFPQIIMGGLLLMKAVEWFVLPFNIGFPVISFAGWCGINFAFAMIRKIPTPKEQTVNELFITIIGGLFAQGFMLFIGWVVHSVIY